MTQKIKRYGINKNDDSGKWFIMYLVMINSNESVLTRDLINDSM